MILSTRRFWVWPADWTKHDKINVYLIEAPSIATDTGTWPVCCALSVERHMKKATNKGFDLQFLFTPTTPISQEG